MLTRKVKRQMSCYKLGSLEENLKWTQNVFMFSFGFMWSFRLVASWLYFSFPGAFAIFSFYSAVVKLPISSLRRCIQMLCAERRFTQFTDDPEVMQFNLISIILWQFLIFAFSSFQMCFHTFYNRREIFMTIIF